MSDDEVDHSLLDLLREKLGLGPKDPHAAAETGVLRDAEFIYNNSVDVALDMRHTKLAAIEIMKQMKEQGYSTQTWSEHMLHPKAKDESTVNFIFTMDLLNYSFWSEKNEAERFAVDYQDQKWTGYWSLVAALQRALEEDIPITTPSFWADRELCTDEVLRNVFRSCTEEEIPMFADRAKCLRQAGDVLEQNFDSSVITLIEDADKSAAKLVNILAEDFPCFNDQGKFDGKPVKLMKRAQIFVADLWAAFNGEGYGEFNDIDKMTMFADYRVPQMLHSLGCMAYCPPLENKIRRHEIIPSGHTWELQLRGCSIWAVELIRREILKLDPKSTINAILIDFFLYDLAKKNEAAGQDAIPHHRTRSIWY